MYKKLRFYYLCESHQPGSAFVTADNFGTPQPHISYMGPFSENKNQNISSNCHPFSNASALQTEFKSKHFSKTLHPPQNHTSFSQNIP